MNRAKNQKGITLIALVITIIVLIILAAVAIATLAGDNGIINRAIQARQSSTTKQEQELVDLVATSIRTEEGVAEKQIVQEVTDANTQVSLQSIIDSIFGENKATGTISTSNNITTYTITVTDGGTYTITTTGVAEQENPNNNTIVITLNANGGFFGSIETVNQNADANGKITISNNPTREGCEFIGWYKNITQIDEQTQEEHTERVDIENISSETFTANTTLYARWRKYLYNEGVGGENWSGRKWTDSWSTTSYYFSPKDDYIEFGDNMSDKIGMTAIYTEANLTGFSKLRTELYLNSLTNYGGTGYNFDYVMSVYYNEIGNGSFYTFNTGNGNIWNAIGNKSEGIYTQKKCREQGSIIGSISNLFLQKRYLVTVDIPNVTTNQTVEIHSDSQQYVDTQIIWRMYRCWLET